MKIAVITCYHDPDYVRARSLRAALKVQPDVELIVIKNKHRGALRYPEVLWKVIKAKRYEKPAAYLLTFRGQEILPAILLIAGRTPVWFDEFVVPVAYARMEKHRATCKKRFIRTLIRIAEPFYRFCLRRCRAILSDTPSHAELSAKLSKVNLRSYLSIPVGTDEKLFKPKLHSAKAEPFQIFYYTTGMQPLHGIPYVLEAAEMLAGDRRFSFVLVGGKKTMKKHVEESVARGARITYHAWVPFDELPSLMQSSHLVLGGPFGGTPQAMHVITGKSYQSLACGVATVVGDNPDTAMYFKDKVNALVVPQKESRSLVSAFVWAVEHPEELRQIGEKGRLLYERQFSNEALARLLAPLVDTLRPSS